ncbi:hypothetical protein E3N88_28127 [Mikania micrantha]|uniref:Uncharacterized protein n=1 Tax=Mikania micrantha TaxID=192012 RepID=A0A5N6MZM3_9ASTR|nr:hypothetical protein E3N88_28127 [Mikania micrantha]
METEDEQGSKGGAGRQPRREEQPSRDRGAQGGSREGAQGGLRSSRSVVRRPWAVEAASSSWRQRKREYGDGDMILSSRRKIQRLPPRDYGHNTAPPKRYPPPVPPPHTEYFYELPSPHN